MPLLLTLKAIYSLDLGKQNITHHVSLQENLYYGDLCYIMFNPEIQYNLETDFKISLTFSCFQYNLSAKHQINKQISVVHATLKTYEGYFIVMRSNVPIPYIIVK